METLRECVQEMNKVFGPKFNKANVIALWPQEKLNKFTIEELDTLETLTREEMLVCGRNEQRMMQRLIVRIGRAR